MHDMCQQNRQSHSLFSVKLDLLSMSLYTFLLLTSSYDACKPSLMRLRLTSAPKAISLFSIGCLAASANQCRNSEISASGSARSPLTQAERDVERVLSEGLLSSSSPLPILHTADKCISSTQ